VSNYITPPPPLVCFTQMEGRQSCMRCNGAGYEPCFCQKWSDGDVGCSACAKRWVLGRSFRAHMHTHVYIYKHTHTYTQGHTCTHTHTHTHHAHARTHLHTNICTHTLTHIYTHAHTHTHIHTNTHIHTHTHMQWVHEVPELRWWRNPDAGVSAFKNVSAVGVHACRRVAYWINAYFI